MSKSWKNEYRVVKRDCKVIYLYFIVRKSDNTDIPMLGGFASKESACSYLNDHFEELLAKDVERILLE